MPYPEAEKIKELIDAATRIVIIQADNPDGDSLGSALAMEQILGDMGKQPWLYCGVDIPSYLRHMPGWDRVTGEFPGQFDLSIIVDTSADSLLETLNKSPQKNWVTSKPVIIIDHHDVEQTITYATVTCNKPAVAAAEVIYELAQQLEWPLNLEAKKVIASAIMSDSLGLTTSSTTARSIMVISELVGGGVSIAELDNARRDMQRKSPDLVHYKGRLLERIEYHSDNRVATVSIPWDEIEQYSPQYNPSILVMDDMRMTTDTTIAIAFKLYNDGHITGKIRANYGYPIANDLAAHFGGGGHKYASGFKIQSGKQLADVKADCVKKATELLDALDTTE
jgi:phosphoesterase RecJ-like protein